MTNTERSRLEVTEIDGVAAVRFHDLDADVSGCQIDKIDSLAAELFSAAKQDPVAMILDFADEEFFPWAAFENVLIRLHKNLGDRLRLCNPPPVVTEQFTRNRLAELFHPHAALEEALAADRHRRK